MSLVQILLLLALIAIVAIIAYRLGRSAAPPPTVPADATGSSDAARLPEPSRGSVPQLPSDANRTRRTAGTPVAPGPVDSAPHVAVRSWGYQLQHLDVARAAASPFDLLVVDYTKDGDDESALTPAEVRRLQTKPDGSRRLVFAYLSIGEAESYRGYWNPAWKKQRPAWLLDENPEWDENYAVCFWDPGWQAIMFGTPSSRLDRIIAAGFDGVYLDKADVFDDLRDAAPKVAKTRPDIEGDMVTFIRRLSTHAKAQRAGFRVIMQNAEGLLERKELRAAIDGCAREELVFGVEAPEKKNSRDEFQFSRENLDLLKREGKLVLVVEYLNATPKIAEARRIIDDLGYVLYIARKDRELDTLVVPPPVA